jgi:hypothetical protein
VDSGASFHMTGCREFFNSLHKEDINFYIEMGNNAKYQPIGHGRVAF